jgi:hypothetical protein
MNGTKPSRTRVMMTCRVLSNPRCPCIKSKAFSSYENYMIRHPNGVIGCPDRISASLEGAMRRNVRVPMELTMIKKSDKRLVMIG